MQETHKINHSVTAIVPCRNEAGSVKQFVNSVFSQDLSGIHFDLIVADGMSEDGTDELLQTLKKEHSNLTVIKNLKKFTAAGLNQALNMASGNIIIRLDVHTEYNSDYIQRCVEILTSTEAQNVGGPWQARGEGFVGESIANVFQLKSVFGGAMNRDTEYEGKVDTVYLGCWRKEDLKKMGGFDEMALRAQDKELNYRLRHAGGVVWQSPKIISKYRVQSSLLKHFRQWAQNAYWNVYVLKKHKRWAIPRNLLAAVLLTLLIFLMSAALFFDPSKQALGCLGFLYLVYLFILSLSLSLKTGVKYLAMYPIIIFGTQFSWGTGFVMGLVDFCLIKRSFFQHAFTRMIR